MRSSMAGGFGGMPGVRRMSTRIALAVIGASILTFALGIQDWLLLIPARVIGDFAIWQPLTYALLGRAPGEVLFSALIIWQMGGFFETTWGPRRTLFFGLGLAAIAGVVTTLLAVFIPSLRGVPFSGAGVIASVLWVGYGLSFGKRQISFWGIPLSGFAFAGIGLLFVVLQAAYSSWIAVVPDAIALGFAALYIRKGSPKVWWLRLQNWRLQRELRGRGKHLRVIDSTPEEDRWLN